eukprot:UN14480
MRLNPVLVLLHGHDLLLRRLPLRRNGVTYWLLLNNYTTS